jgi:dTDP-glucose pyrophosphorylase
MMIQIIVLAAADYANNESPSKSSFPRNLQDINGKIQIIHVLDSLELMKLTTPYKAVVCLSQEECLKYHTDKSINLNFPELLTFPISGNPNGAAATALRVIDNLDLDLPLLVTNGDHVLEGGVKSMLDKSFEINSDAIVLTFDNSHPRWSYVKESSGEVTMAAEKVPMSRSALTGFFYFRTAGIFLNAASEYMLRRSPTQLRYFISPILNEVILLGGVVSSIPAPTASYHSLSTKDDLQMYRDHLKERQNVN